MLQLERWRCSSREGEGGREEGEKAEERMSIGWKFLGGGVEEEEEEEEKEEEEEEEKEEEEGREEGREGWLPARVMRA
jgi:hypothetical protein